MTATTSAFEVGTLVTPAAGNGWCCRSRSRPDFLVLRPLGGGDDEVAGVFPKLEQVSPATFEAPDPGDAGTATARACCGPRCGSASAPAPGPFRSLARLAVEPRAYQLVPLLMALRQDTVRMLISDDVGIGKTVEAGLIAAELLEQGDASGLAVLCSPALAEQWQRELRQQVRHPRRAGAARHDPQAGTGLLPGETLFDRYPNIVVSTDFIKRPGLREQFWHGCPDLLIIDEAHTCVSDGTGGRSRMLRHELVTRPGQGREPAPGPGHRHPAQRQGGRLPQPARPAGAEPRVRRPGDGRGPGAAGAVLRAAPAPATSAIPRRGHPVPRGPADPGADVRAAPGVQGAVRRRARVRARDGPRPRGRQAPAAGAVLVGAGAAAGAGLVAAGGRRHADHPGGQPRRRGRGRGRPARPVRRPGPARRGDGRVRRRDARRGRRHCRGGHAAPPAAEALRRPAPAARRRQGDRSSSCSSETVKELLLDGFNPIIFCRFIDTAEYVAEHLAEAPRRRLRGRRGHRTLPPDERVARIEELTSDEAKRPVLVATDCLSEGVNLQEHFQAVVHYDLAWNPTRHEQREGRVDRFGQRARTVRAVTIYGADNGIDGIVLDVLLRKHEQIRKALGISVPVPDRSDDVVEAILEGLLLRDAPGEQLTLDFGLERRDDLHREWDSAAAEEKASPSPSIAQSGIQPGEVARELAEIRASLGTPSDIAAFTEEALRALRADVTGYRHGFAPPRARCPSACATRWSRATRSRCRSTTTCRSSPARPTSTAPTRTSPRSPATSWNPRWTRPCPPARARPAAAA